MKLELGKRYKTKNGWTIDIMSTRDVYDSQEKRFLGVISDGIPETFWYNENGRLYNNGISPFDIEKELKHKLEFKTKIIVENGKLIAKWPQKDLIENFNNSNVKITVELVNG